VTGSGGPAQTTTETGPAEPGTSRFQTATGSPRLDRLGACTRDTRPTPAKSSRRPHIGFSLEIQRLLDSTHPLIAQQIVTPSCRLETGRRHDLPIRRL